MNAKKIIILVTTISLLTTLAFCADSETGDAHPIIGIQLDPSPLPELLAKHLGLSPGQGLRISNIMEGTAADIAGLDKDDIITSLNGEAVNDYKYFVESIQKADAWTEVQLDIIHLGQPKSVKLKLQAWDEDAKWKYPMEPQIEQLWRPGRIFRLRPGDEDWDEILADQLPLDIRSNITKNFKEMYSSHHKIGNQEYSVTIDGNPNNGNSIITINSGNEEYKTTISEIDQLPKEYQGIARQALDNAKNKITTWRTRIDALKEKDELSSQLNDTSPRQYLRRWIITDPNSLNSSLSDKVEEQMKQLQKQIQELEKSHSELLDRMNEKIENLKNPGKDDPML